MRGLQFLLVFLALSTFGFSQNMDSGVFTRISTELLERYFEDFADDENIERRGDCTFGKKEDLTLSCISITWDLLWISDFDGDSISDIIVRFTNEGLGGGGNMFGYHFEIVTLDKDEKIKEVHSLFGGGKFSYAHLSIDSVSQGKIYATYKQNSYAYDFDDVAFENPEQLSLEFFLTDNGLQEENYAKCPIASMNKTIFRNDIDFKIDRSHSLDDRFNIEQVERLEMKDSSEFIASLSGCDNIDLSFHHTLPFNAALEKDKAAVKSIWMEYLLFLKDNTRYATVMSELLLQINELESKKIKPDAYGGFKNECTLSNNWKAYLFVSGNEEQGSFITLRFLKSTETEELPFWETLKRKNNL